MRQRLDWGLSTLIERAAGLSQLPKGRKPTPPTREGQPEKKQPTYVCDGCGSDAYAQYYRVVLRPVEHHKLPCYRELGPCFFFLICVDMCLVCLWFPGG